MLLTINYVAGWRQGGIEPRLVCKPQDLKSCLSMKLSCFQFSTGVGAAVSPGLTAQAKKQTQSVRVFNYDPGWI